MPLMYHRRNTCQVAKFLSERPSDGCREAELLGIPLRKCGGKSAEVVVAENKPGVRDPQKLKTGNLELAKDRTDEEPLDAPARLDISYMSSNPGWSAPTVNYGSHQDSFRIVGVVDGKWKAVRKCPVETTIRLRMYSAKYLQGLDV